MVPGNRKSLATVSSEICLTGKRYSIPSVARLIPRPTSLRTRTTWCEYSAAQMRYISVDTPGRPSVGDIRELLNISATKRGLRKCSTASMVPSTHPARLQRQTCIDTELRYTPRNAPNVIRPEVAQPKSSICRWSGEKMVARCQRYRRRVPWCVSTRPPPLLQQTCAVRKHRYSRRNKSVAFA